MMNEPVCPTQEFPKQPSPDSGTALPIQSLPIRVTTAVSSVTRRSLNVLNIRHGAFPPRRSPPISEPLPCTHGSARLRIEKFRFPLTRPQIVRLGIIELTLASALDFSYLWLRLRYFASEKMQASLLFSLGLFVSLSHPCGYGGIGRHVRLRI